jgi:sortase A
MNDDNKKHNDQFSASLHLPGEPDEPKKPDDANEPNPAADLIRKKVDAAYRHEPDAEAESDDIEDLGKTLKRSKHQEFIYNLTNSGRPLHEIQTAWHEYYAGLTDADKHLVWQEFYSAHAQAAHHPAVAQDQPKSATPKPAIRHTVASKTKTKVIAPKKAGRRQAPPKTAAHQTLHSLLFGLGTGSIVILIFLFSFFNERIIAPFIQPSRNSTNIPIISDGAVSSAPEVIIPKINVEIPVVYDVASINDADIQVGLQRGAVHYATTAAPGQDGNVVIVGHSSGNIFNQGNYKFAFSLLRAIDPGDTFFLQKDGKRYTYQVYLKRVVKPTDVSVLGPADKPATATLITCDPPGTSASRLVITAQQISPDPTTNTAAAPQTPATTAAAIVPGDSPTLWSRLTKWFAG